MYTTVIIIKSEEEISPNLGLVALSSYIENGSAKVTETKCYKSEESCGCRKSPITLNFKCKEHSSGPLPFYDEDDNE